MQQISSLKPREKSSQRTFYGTCGNEPVHDNLLRLTDPVGSVNGLFVFEWRPGWIVHDDSIRSGQGNTDAGSLEAQGTETNKSLPRTRTN